VNKYILEGKNAIPCGSIFEWSRWFETANRRVALDKKDGIEVSTVFLGLDYSFGGAARPLLFETMIFGGKHDEMQVRCSTWEEAEEQHKTMCKLAFD
jgi:hypothetical protein